MRHYANQPACCPSRGLLRDCTTSQINRLQHYLIVVLPLVPGSCVVLCKHRSDEVAQKATFWSDGTIIWV